MNVRLASLVTGVACPQLYMLHGADENLVDLRHPYRRPIGSSTSSRYVSIALLQSDVANRLLQSSKLATGRL